MCVISSDVLRVVMFPHEGKLVTVYQLSFTLKGCLETKESTIPLIIQTKPANESLGVGMYAYFMGTFGIPTPINYLVSTSVGNSIAMVVDRTDPWVLPSHHEPQVPLSIVEVAYQAIINTTIDSIATPSTVSEESEETYLPAWA